jgi:hypothetical protein
MVDLLFSTDDQPYSVRPISARNFVHYLANKPLGTNKDIMLPAIANSAAIIDNHNQSAALRGIALNSSTTPVEFCIVIVLQSFK